MKNLEQKVFSAIIVMFHGHNLNQSEVKVISFTKKIIQKKPSGGIYPIINKIKFIIIFIQ